MFSNPIPASEATTVEALREEYWGLPQATITGIVCAECSTIVRRNSDDPTAVIRHATVDHVRFCCSQIAAMDLEHRQEMAVGA
jgi:hypothetical protein